MNECILKLSMKTKTKMLPLVLALIQPKIRKMSISLLNISIPVVKRAQMFIIIWLTEASRVRRTKIKKKIHWKTIMFLKEITQYQNKSVVCLTSTRRKRKRILVIIRTMFKKRILWKSYWMKMASIARAWLTQMSRAAHKILNLNQRIKMLSVQLTRPFKWTDERKINPTVLVACSKRILQVLNSIKKTLSSMRFSKFLLKDVWDS